MDIFKRYIQNGLLNTTQTFLNSLQELQAKGSIFIKLYVVFN